METGRFEKLWTVLISLVVVLLILLAALLVFHANKIGAALLILLAGLFMLLVIKNYLRRSDQGQLDKVNREQEPEKETEGWDNGEASEGNSDAFQNESHYKTNPDWKYGEELSSLNRGFSSS